MAKLPQLTAIQLAKVIAKLEFEFIRQEGSHMFFKHSDGRTTVLPNHPGEKIGTGLLLKIIKKDLQITREQFEGMI
jgi:predicted RNA binding protein YcfA (HicA-like mRNA interferase family)